MAKLNRKYIDKHWMIFIVRGVLALVFGCLTLFGSMEDLEFIIVMVSLFLLIMGIVDSIGALYASLKKRGWVNSVIDALVDVAASMCLLFFARTDFTMSVIILAVYTCVSGIIDILHGFLSTVDPTDRFIRILTGIIGCVVGFVVLNSGELFIRFFGAYLLIVGVTSLVYGAHNRAQEIEDKIARSQAQKQRKKKVK